MGTPYVVFQSGPLSLELYERSSTFHLDAYDGEEEIHLADGLTDAQLIDMAARILYPICGFNMDAVKYELERLHRELRRELC